MKAMTCRAVAKEHAQIAAQCSRGLWRKAYSHVVEVCHQHVAHKARAIRELARLAKMCEKTAIGDVYVIAARWLTGTPSD